jgi:hypothetical protein
VHEQYAASLRAEIESLKLLVHPPVAIPSFEQRESDLMLSGTQEREAPTQLQQDQIQAEAIFSATHDEISW